MIKYICAKTNVINYIGTYIYPINFSKFLVYANTLLECRQIYTIKEVISLTRVATFLIFDSHFQIVISN